jgi:NAD(P)-dependent dehydrogenase (short-subunit alcohol dehydrogenase family)
MRRDAKAIYDCPDASMHSKELRFPMPHPAFSPANVAVVTGGASGIGLAAACRFAQFGMKVCIADIGEEKLDAAKQSVIGASAAGPEAVMTAECDVSDIEGVRNLERRVREKFGAVHVVMNNAGIQPGSSIFGSPQTWRRIIDVNLWGVVNGSQVFAPNMIAQGTPGLIVNTGSKQGITTPPGDPAYNVSKAGVKAFTEALQHELRTTPQCQISAHLLIPGFVFTPLTARARAEKPAGAWTPDETVRFMLTRLEAGDFYILCPDNDVDRATDERRILWAAGDIVENRPPLSRWHPDYADRFAAFSKAR